MAANTVFEEELKKQAAANAPADKGYKATGTYMDAGLSAADKAKVDALGTQWKAATAAGNTTLADQYHQQAEAIRSQYGYSGGKDGSEYNPIQNKPHTMDRVSLPSYEAQVEPTNKVYDAAKDAVLAQLETAYQNNRIEAEAAKAKIPGVYQQQANAVAADAAIQQRNFNEQAAASGLNTGTGSQVRLSQNNALLGGLSDLRRSQAEAENDMDTKLLQLYTSYQNSITEALANNEYERAAALLGEYQKAAASAVDVAQVQAGLDMETAGFNRDTQALELEWARKYGYGAQPSGTSSTIPANPSPSVDLTNVFIDKNKVANANLGYGTGYNTAYLEALAMKNEGISGDKIAAMLAGYGDSQLTDAGIERILRDIAPAQ